MSEEINKAEETKVEEESLAAEETRMISDEARWYVVHTYSGYENKVGQHRKDSGKQRDAGSDFRGQRTPAGRC